MVFPLLRQSAGVMESMKSQTPSTKLQTNLKFQYSMTKTKNRFGISNFGHCDLFDICDLLFGISIPPVLQNSSQSLPAKPFNSAPRKAGSLSGPPRFAPYTLNSPTGYTSLHTPYNPSLSIIRLAASTPVLKLISRLDLYRPSPAKRRLPRSSANIFLNSCCCRTEPGINCTAPCGQR